MEENEKLSPSCLSEVREFQTPSSGIFFKIHKILYSQNSPYQKIEVLENEAFGRILLLDGLVQTTERDEFFYHEMLVHPALMSHPAPCKILIIGGGDGGTLREVLRHPVEKVFLVEIDSQVIEVSEQFFPWLKSSLEDSRAQLIISDGEAFVDRTEEKFDVILIDSSDPVGPSTRLHQPSFYKKLKACLNPGGIVTAQAGSLFFHQEHLKGKRLFLEKLFRIVRFFTGPVPTYPGGSWCYEFLSDEVDPFQALRREVPSGLKYYNPEIHRSAFALPVFLKK